ncbi:MAG: acyloxyacyl hydrolase [Planctomycetota bacterium]|jgi:hypothetical protein
MRTTGTPYISTAQQRTTMGHDFIVTRMMAAVTAPPGARPRRAGSLARLIVAGLVVVTSAATDALADGPIDRAPEFDEASLARMAHLSFDQPPPEPDSSTADAPTDVPAAPAPGAFSKETWTGHVLGSAIFGDSGKGEMYLVHAGFGYFFEDYQSINVSFFGGYVRSGIDDNGVAGGFDVIYRNHLHRSDDEDFSVYFEAGLGLQQASTNFSGERHFNFRNRIGFGMSFELAGQSRLLVAGNYIHISDAGIEGGGGGFDGPMLYAGVTFPF